jgi:anti-anti-sigma factor
METIQDEHEITFLLKSDFVLANTERIKDLMLAQLAEVKKETRISLDLSSMQNLDTFGVRVILGLAKSCKEKGCPLSVKTSDQNLKEIFQFLKLGSLLALQEEDAS